MWSKNPKYQYNTRYAKMVFYIRKKEIRKLKKMAKKFEGHYYLQITKKATWEEAARICGLLKGHLVTVSSRAENDFLCHVMQDNHYAWIGIINDNGRWKWLNEEPMNYCNTEHRNDAGIYSSLLFGGQSNGGKWVAAPDVLESGFIIEWDG